MYCIDYFNDHVVLLVDVIYFLSMNCLFFKYNSLNRLYCVIFTARRLPDGRVPGRTVQGSARPRRQGIDPQENDGAPLISRRVHLRQETSRNGHLRVQVNYYSFFF